jgi:hypothetical protein
VGADDISRSGQSWIMSQRDADGIPQTAVSSSGKYTRRGGGVSLVTPVDGSAIATTNLVYTLFEEND